MAILNGSRKKDTLTGGVDDDQIFGRQNDDILNGGDGNDMLFGEAGNDTLNGGAGNDYLDGGAGTDIMAGGAGNDIYVVGSATDVVTESGGEGTDTVQSSISYTLANNVENLVLMGTANLTGNGNAQDNELYGNDGNNTLDGKAGADLMAGGDGDDIYVVDNVGDTVVELADEGIDTVKSSVSYALSDNVEKIILTGTASIDATGNSLANTLTGNSGANVLDGGEGADTMTGGAGDDTYVIDSALDLIVENASQGTDTVRSGISYTLGANLENIALVGDADINATGSAGNNVLTGNTGANTLIGNAGNDTLDGSAGIDTAIYLGNRFDYTITQTATGYQIVDNAAGRDGTDALTSVEKLVFADLPSMNLGTNNAVVGDVTIAGDAALGRTLTATANLFDADGLGTITYQWLSDGAAIAGATGDSFVLGDAQVGTTITVTASYTDGFGTLESVTSAATEIVAHQRGDAGDNLIIGTPEPDILAGGAGNDTIDGLQSADTMLGGTGNDTFYVDNAGDVVVENASEGTDTVVTTSLMNYTLDANVENLTMMATNIYYVGLHGTGNSLDNVMNTVEGYWNDTLDGGAGADTMSGGWGGDTYFVDNAGDVVIEDARWGGTDTVVSSINYTLGDGLENLTFAASGITGTGNASDNVYTVFDGSNRIVEAVGSGIDTVNTGVSYSLDANIENAVLTAGGITVTGNELDNTYRVLGVAGTTIAEALNGGTDTVVTTGLMNYTLDANVENLTMMATNIYYVGLHGTGNSLDNVMNTVEGYWNDTLDGGAGGDTMSGGWGGDTYFVDNAGDVVIEDASWGGTDTVVSSINYTLGDGLENLTLVDSANLSGTGNELNNVLTGNTGNNILTGGAGNDIFRFDQALNAATNLDTITDFTIGTDSIQLENAIFTALTAGGLSADAFIGGADITAAADADDHLIYNSTTGALYYDPDGSGSDVAIQFASLSAGLALSAGDFVVS